MSKEEKTVNEVVLLRTADGFFSVGQTLYKKYKYPLNFLLYYVSPYVVNMAFACELYLKYLYTMSTGDKRVIKAHALEEVYKLLDQKTQEELKLEFCEVLTQSDEPLLDFEKCLNIHNNAFIGFRYMYETDPEREALRFETTSLHNLAVVLRNKCTDFYNIAMKNHTSEKQP